MKFNTNIHFKTFTSLFCMLLFLFSNVQGQIVTSMSLSPDTVTIGDPVTLNIKIVIPKEIVVTGIDLSALLKIENIEYQSDTNYLDKFADLSVLSFGNWKHTDINRIIEANSLKISSVGGNQVIENTIKLAVYNKGIFKFVNPAVITENKTDVIPTERPLLVVLLPEKLIAKDSISLNPIKDILREEINISDYINYLFLLGGFLLIGLAAYFFYRIKKKKKENEVEIPVIELPAWEKALLALKTLESKQLWQYGQIKEYQTQLTQIIREYIKDHYNINALEMTTDEISSELMQISIESTLIRELREILQIADLVKFAKAVPDEDVHSRFMKQAIDFVENTKTFHN